MRFRPPMQKFFALLLAVFTAAFLLPVKAAPAEGAVTYMRVLLSTEGASSLRIPVKGSYVLAESKRSFTGGTLRVKAEGSTVTVSHSAEGVLYTGSAATVERTDLSRNGGTLTVETLAGKRNYLGHFTFKARDGQLMVINRVPMSHYLYGVVAYEMSNEFPMEALKAQAVTAKGYALLHMGASGSYDIGDTASDQVYRGYDPANTNVISAVDSTIGDVLYYNGKPLLCYYAASNGGWMILPGDRWGDKSEDGAYRSGEDGYDMKNPSSPRETVLIPSDYSEREMGTSAFAFLDGRLMAAIAAEGIIPAEFHFSAVTSVDKVTSSGSGKYKGDRDYTTVAVSATVRADRDPQYIPTPTPSFAPTPSPTPEITPTPSPTPEWISPSPTPETTPPPPGEDGTVPPWESPSPTPEITPPAPTPAWDPTPSPTPSHAPTPSPTPEVEVSRNISVSVRFPYEELVKAGLFANSKLKIFYSEKTQGGYALLHARYGHGIGMSQRGAQQMASEGRSFREILAYYYPGATLGSMSFRSPETVEAPSASGAAASTVASTGQVVGDTVNLRQKTSTSSQSLEKLPVGTGLILLGMKGGWYYVSAPSGNTGYVRHDYVSLTGEGVIAAGEVSGSAVNCRTGPGTDYDAIARLSKGTALGVYGMVDGWYKVKAMTTGDVGFVSGDYVTITRETAETTQPAAPVVTAAPNLPVGTPLPAGVTPGPVVIAPDATATPSPRATLPPTPTPMAVYAAAGSVNGSRVNIRAGASTRTKSFGKLNRDTALGLYEKTGSWYRVKVLSSGQEGYIYAKYVSLNGSQGDTNAPAPTADPTAGLTASVSRGYINSSGVRLRKGPGLGYDGVAKMGKNTTVKILGSEGSWYSVEVAAGGATGYVFGKYVTMTGTQKSDTATGVITARLNLRTAATTGPGSRVLTVMDKGAVVTVHNTVNGWCYVTYEGQNGYCISSCVRVG